MWSSKENFRNLKNLAFKKMKKNDFFFALKEYAKSNGMNNLSEYKAAINDKALVKKFTQDLEKHCLKCM